MTHWCDPSHTHTNHVGSFHWMKDDSFFCLFSSWQKRKEEGRARTLWRTNFKLSPYFQAWALRVSQDGKKAQVCTFFGAHTVQFKRCFLSASQCTTVSSLPGPGWVALKEVCMTTLTDRLIYGTKYTCRETFVTAQRRREIRTGDLFNRWRTCLSVGAGLVPASLLTQHSPVLSYVFSASNVAPYWLLHTDVHW